MGCAGVPLGPQISKLNRGCDVVVGTPGRIIDLIENSGALNLSQVRIRGGSEGFFLAIGSEPLHWLLNALSQCSATCQEHLECNCAQ